ncbi:hypothetical protein [Parafrankia discariae]|uniref:hypothetical protein n=1 Tax=Parafrankia discariae TaxID=365528 RepID=UPI0003A7F527|nr:hypothetical protein [Parafrankia discariae]
MLLRTIRGRVVDERALRAELRGWAAEAAEAAGVVGGAEGLGPGGGSRADRFGVTAGMAGDGLFVGLLLLPGDTARAVPHGTPHGTRWRRLGRWLCPAVVVDHPCVQVVGEMAVGEVAPEPGATEAGRHPGQALNAARYVRVTWGRTVDRSALWALRRRLADRLPDGRPDLLGLLSAATAGGALVEVAYHESEELTHAADRGDPDPEVAELLDEARALVTVSGTDVLRSPWPHLPAPCADPPQGGRDGVAPTPDRGGRERAAPAALGAAGTTSVHRTGTLPASQSSSGISSHHWHHQSPPTRIRSFGCQQ